MATVYKIEIEVTSDWVNYTPEQMKLLIELTLADSHQVEIQSLRNIDVDVTRIA